MGFFTRLERLSEKYIEGFFKTRFADHIQPAEIAKLLLREMRDNKNVSISAVYVPNEYTVVLGAEDWRVTAPVHASLAKELQEFLRQKAEEKEYTVLGEIGVVFAQQEQLPMGSVEVKSSFSQEVPGGAGLSGEKLPAGEEAGCVSGVYGVSAGQGCGTGESTLVADRVSFQGQNQAVRAGDTLTRSDGNAAAPKAVLVQKIGTGEGTRFPLGTQGKVIGRRRSNDISLEDSNISRVHASLDYDAGAYLITDLGSTNGTFVNGIRISRKKLAHGDLIRMGSTILEFRVV